MTTPSPTNEVDITEVFPGGMAYMARIHATGCRDIERERRKLAATTLGKPEVWQGTYTGEQWLEVNFGDVAGDSTEEGTEEWRQELRFQASDVTICGCAKAKGFGF